MGVRGRKSTAAMLNVVAVGGERLEPPPELDAAERAEWAGIVDSLPADYFRPSDRLLLAAYCISWVFYKEAAMQLKRDGIVLGDDKKYAHPAGHFLMSQASAMAQMAVKLRLCPSSRYSEKAAATKAGSSKNASALWEFGKSANRQ